MMGEAKPLLLQRSRFTMQNLNSENFIIRQKSKGVNLNFIDLDKMLAQMRHMGLKSSNIFESKDQSKGTISVTSYKKRKFRRNQGSSLGRSQVFKSGLISQNNLVSHQMSRSASDFGMSKMKVKKDDSKAMSKLAQAVEVRRLHQNLHEYSILKLEQRIQIWESQQQQSSTVIKSSRKTFKFEQLGNKNQIRLKLTDLAKSEEFHQVAIKFWILLVNFQYHDASPLTQTILEKRSSSNVVESDHRQSCLPVDMVIYKQVFEVIKKGLGCLTDPLFSPLSAKNSLDISSPQLDRQQTDFLKLDDTAEFQILMGQVYFDKFLLDLGLILGIHLTNFKISDIVFVYRKVLLCVSYRFEENLQFLALENIYSPFEQTQILKYHNKLQDPRFLNQESEKLFDSKNDRAVSCDNLGKTFYLNPPSEDVAAQADKPTGQSGLEISQINQQNFVEAHKESNQNSKQFQVLSAQSSRRKGHQTGLSFTSQKSTHNEILNSKEQIVPELVLTGSPAKMKEKIQNKQKVNSRAKNVKISNSNAETAQNIQNADQQQEAPKDLSLDNLKVNGIPQNDSNAPSNRSRTSIKLDMQQLNLSKTHNQFSQASSSRRRIKLASQQDRSEIIMEKLDDKSVAITNRGISPSPRQQIQNCSPSGPSEVHNVHVIATPQAREDLFDFERLFRERKEKKERHRQKCAQVSQQKSQLKPFHILHTRQSVKDVLAQTKNFISSIEYKAVLTPFGNWRQGLFTPLAQNQSKKKTKKEEVNKLKSADTMRKVQQQKLQNVSQEQQAKRQQDIEADEKFGEVGSVEKDAINKSSITKIAIQSAPFDESSSVTQTSDSAQNQAFNTRMNRKSAKQTPSQRSQSSGGDLQNLTKLRQRFSVMQTKMSADYKFDLRKSKVDQITKRLDQEHAIDDLLKVYMRERLTMEDKTARREDQDRLKMVFDQIDPEKTYQFPRPIVQKQLQKQEDFVKDQHQNQQIRPLISNKQVKSMRNIKRANSNQLIAIDSNLPKIVKNETPYKLQQPVVKEQNPSRGSELAPNLTVRTKMPTHIVQKGSGLVTSGRTSSQEVVGEVEEEQLEPNQEMNPIYAMKKQTNSIQPKQIPLKLADSSREIHQKQTAREPQTPLFVMPIDKNYLEEQEGKVRQSQLLEKRKGKIKDPVLVVNLSEASDSEDQNRLNSEEGLLEKARNSLVTAHLNEERGQSDSDYLSKRSYSQNTTTNLEPLQERRGSTRISGKEIIVKTSLRPSPVLSRRNSFVNNNKELLNLDLNYQDDLVGGGSTESVNKTIWNTPHLQETQRLPQATATDHSSAQAPVGSLQKSSLVSSPRKDAYVMINFERGKGSQRTLNKQSARPSNFTNSLLRIEDQKESKLAPPVMMFGQENFSPSKNLEHQNKIQRQKREQSAGGALQKSLFALRRANKSRRQQLNQTQQRKNEHIKKQIPVPGIIQRVQYDVKELNRLHEEYALRVAQSRLKSEENLSSANISRQNASAMVDASTIVVGDDLMQSFGPYQNPFLSPHDIQQKSSDTHTKRQIINGQQSPSTLKREDLLQSSLGSPERVGKFPPFGKFVNRQRSNTKLSQGQEKLDLLVQTRGQKQTSISFKNRNQPSSYQKSSELSSGHNDNADTVLDEQKFQKGIQLQQLAINVGDQQYQRRQLKPDEPIIDLLSEVQQYLQK